MGDPLGSRSRRYYVYYSSRDLMLDQMSKRTEEPLCFFTYSYSLKMFQLDYSMLRRHSSFALCAHNHSLT